tara:strand:+ start:821 stop:1174 length:354 start_codon:yes stop_codon:yes gene_type:complete
MAETTQLELVTPANIMVQKAAEMVVAPGAEGFFGAMPRHAPLLSDLVRGIVEVHENGKVTDRFMIDGGLADVSHESVTILTERAENLSTVARDELKARADAASGSEADFLNAVLAAL